jgi:hypothetical protein
MLNALAMSPKHGQEPILVAMLLTRWIDTHQAIEVD